MRENITSNSNYKAEARHFQIHTIFMLKGCLQQASLSNGLSDDTLQRFLHGRHAGTLCGSHTMQIALTAFDAFIQKDCGQTTPTSKTTICCFRFAASGKKTESTGRCERRWRAREWVQVRQKLYLVQLRTGIHEVTIKISKSTSGKSSQIVQQSSLCCSENIVKFCR